LTLEDCLSPEADRSFCFPWFGGHGHYFLMGRPRRKGGRNDFDSDEENDDPPTSRPTTTTAPIKQPNAQRLQNSLGETHASQLDQPRAAPPPLPPPPPRLSHVVNLFCYFCTSPNVPVGFNIYSDDDLFLHRLLLSPTSTPNLFSGQITVFDDDLLRGRFCADLESVWKEENVNSNRTWFGNQDKSQYRVWSCTSAKVNFATVVSDIFQYSNWPNKTSEASVLALGWNHLFRFIGSSFLHSELTDYLPNLLTFNFGRYEPPPQLKVRSAGLLKFFLDTAPHCSPGDIFLKWIILLNLIKRMSPTRMTVSLVIDQNILSLLERIDAIDICKLNIQYPEIARDNLSILREIISQIVDLQMSECVPWALLRLTFSQNDTAENLLRRHRDHISPYMNAFLPYIAPDIVPLGLLPNLRVLKHILEKNGRSMVDAHTVQKIISNSDYFHTLERAGPVEGLAELKVMYSFLSNDSSLWKIIPNHPLFQLHSFALADLTTAEFVDVALFQFIKSANPPDTQLHSRCASIVDYLATLVDDQDFAANIYRCLTLLMDLPHFPEKSFLIRTIHSSLPTVQGKGSRYRIECYLVESDERVVELEKNSFLTLCDNPMNDIFGMRSTIWRVSTKKGMLSKSNVFLPRLVDLLSLFWEKSLEHCPRSSNLSPSEIDCLVALLPEKGFSKHYTIQLLSSDRVRELHNLVLKEVADFPHLEVESYRILHEQYSQTCLNIDAIATRLRDQTILASTFDLILRHDWIMINLPSLSHSIITKAMVTDTKTRIDTIRGEWINLVTTFRDFMSLHPRFTQSSQTYVLDVEMQIQSMQADYLCNWYRPTFGGADMKERSRKLEIARSSFVYQWVFARQIEEEKGYVSPEPNAALEEWKSSIDRSLQSWCSAISCIADGSYSSDDLKSLIAPIIESIPDCPEIPNDQVQARGVISRHAIQVQEHLKKFASDEAKLSSAIMQGVKGNEFEDRFRTFLSVMAFGPVGDGLKELFELLSYQFDETDPLVRLIAKAHDPSALCVADLCSLFVQARNLYPEVFLIAREFPSDLCLLIKEDFLVLINEVIDVQSLNQTVERLQNQVEPELLNGLYVLRNVYSAFAVDVAGFTAFRLKNQRNLHSTCSYFASVDWCSSEVKLLIGAVRVLIDIYSGGVSRTSTVALVHSLLSTGEFTISLPEATLSAVITLNSAIKALNPIELGDIPFQLCLHGSVTTIDDSIDTSHQRHFLKIMELLTQLREVLSKLCGAGHPNFQESRLKIPGAISIEDLELLVGQHQNIDSDWHKFLSEYADVNLPLLTCISRKQLVESLKVLTRVDSEESFGPFVLILRSVYPLMTNDQALHHVRSVVQNQHAVKGAKQLFEQVHKLLKRGSSHLFPPVIAKRENLFTVCGRFHHLLPPQLNRSPSGVSVLKLHQDDRLKHCELCCSLFIHLHSRLPTALEIFHCTPESSEQMVIDFLRRWAASQHFQQYFPKSETFLFCMLNVELLKPNIQNAALSKINTVRNNLTSPLILFASSDPHRESLVCLGLKSEWVIARDDPPGSLMMASKEVCTAFFNLVFPQVYLYSSPHPQSGKSSAILDDLVFRQNEESLVYSRIPLTENLDDVIQLLTAVETDREMVHSPECVVLHLNVCSVLDVQQLIRFVMSYIVTGVCMNADGGFCIRNPNDIIAIEWPSEGYLADQAIASSGLCSSFNPRSPHQVVSLNSYEFLPCLENPDCILFRLERHTDIEMNIGIKMAIAFFQVNNTDINNLVLPFPDDLLASDLPDRSLIYQIFSQKISEELKTVTAPPPGFVYRFIKFFSHQLFGLFHFPCYQNSPHVEPENGRNYRRLAYYLALTSFKLAIELAAPAVRPLTEDTNDDDRLSNLIFSFEDWKKIPFLIFTVNRDRDILESDYTMVSVTSENFLSEITAKDRNQDFKNFIDTNVRGQSDNLLQNVCAGLNDEKYEPSTDSRDDHPLRKLLPIVNSKPNFGLLIFSALDYLRRDPTIAPNTPITLLYDDHFSALEQLRSITGYSELDDTKTISNFKGAAQRWFESITGSYSSEQAPFVLTIDNLVRILAMKLRLACKIPVVFMGETGCGKVGYSLFVSIHSE
jgi:hypothetical protein